MTVSVGLAVLAGQGVVALVDVPTSSVRALANTPDHRKHSFLVAKATLELAGHGQSASLLSHTFQLHHYGVVKLS